MRKLFQALGQCMRERTAAVLVTVIASSGSVPRGAGAHMLVTRQGRIAGTIGGGAVEYRCEQLAREVLLSGGSRIESFPLRPNDVQDLGMICGGDVRVELRCLPAGDAETAALCERVEALHRRGEPSWLIVGLSEGGGLSVYGKRSGLCGAPVPETVLHMLTNQPQRILAEGQEFCCEKLIQGGRVYIFGGGHVAQSLVPALSAVEFRCVVLEDRPEFCRAELFPGVEETRLIDIDDPDAYRGITGEDCICIMTRGHKDDLTVQKHALKTPARYIGVIGSRRKAAGVAAKLREMGYSDAALARITTPIGLDIKAETPAEIAVSIAAQLIQKRAEIR